MLADQLFRSDQLVLESLDRSQKTPVPQNPSKSHGTLKPSNLRNEIAGSYFQEPINVSALTNVHLSIITVLADEKGQRVKVQGGEEV